VTRYATILAPPWQLLDSPIIEGDCLEVMRQLPERSIDAVVTDPPYGLSREPDIVEVLQHWLAGDDYEHCGGGFMGASWDSFVPGPVYWREALRVSKSIDKAAGAERPVIGTTRKSVASMGPGEGPFSDDAYEWKAEFDRTGPATPDADRWDGWGTALKPGYEPIVLARKPLSGTVAANVLEHGTGAVNIDACRVGDDTSRGDRYRGSAPGGGDGLILRGGKQTEPWDVRPGRLCVVCGEPAGPWGHHALRKEWVARIGLRAHIWDVELGIPPCNPCHINHEAGAARIERAHLIPTGHWETLTRWAALLDARYVESGLFVVGSTPLLSRLERDYPARLLERGS